MWIRMWLGTWIGEGSFSAQLRGGHGGAGLLREGDGMTAGPSRKRRSQAVARSSQEHVKLISCYS